MLLEKAATMMRPAQVGKDLVEGLADRLFRKGVALPLHVGGIGQQRQDALPRRSGRRMARSVSWPSTGVWSSLKSPVWITTPSGVVMARAQPSTMEWATRRNSTLKQPSSTVSRGLTTTQFHLVVQFVLLQLFVDESQGQGRAVDRHVQLLQHEGQGADMVLVAVGQADGADLVAAFAQPGDIGDDVIDAEHVRLGKHQAAVDDDDVVAVLIGHHVHADFAQAAEGDDLQCCC